MSIEHRLNGGPKKPPAWGTDRLSDPALEILWNALKLSAPSMMSFNPRYADTYALVRLAREVKLARQLPSVFRTTARKLADTGGCQQCIDREEHECAAGTAASINLLLHMADQTEEHLALENPDA